ncbi:MAG TPA: PPOX class F420-dependent oxidoreductase [Pseudonocardiaceae bacterium]
MELDRALAVVDSQHRAVLTTLRRDGTPQMSPVLVGRSGDTLVVSSREPAMKTRNVRRDPRAWLCVLPDEFFGRWVQIEGTVSVLSLPEAMEPLVEYYRGISGEHPDWDEYRADMERERRVLLVLTPTRAGPDAAG